MSVTTVTPPAKTCVTLDAAKAFLRIDGYEENDLLLTLIEAATEQAEAFTGQSFINRTLRLTLDAFPYNGADAWWDGVRDGAISSLLPSPAHIVLPRSPIASVTSITTYSASGAATVMNAAAYQLNPTDHSVNLRSGYAWPTDLRASAGIEVAYVAGYGPDPANLPARVRLGVLQQVAALYENRDGSACMCDAGRESLASLRILGLR